MLLVRPRGNLSHGAANNQDQGAASVAPRAPKGLLPNERIEPAVGNMTADGWLTDWLTAKETGFHVGTF